MAWGRLTAAISGFVSSGAAQSRRVGGFGLSTSNERIVSVPLAWSPIYNEEDIAGISVLPMVPLCQFCGAHRLPCEAPFFCCACGFTRNWFLFNVGYTHFVRLARFSIHCHHLYVIHMVQENSWFC
ncbi:uncharacterized protein [Primulina huaijiensis]|uniref:uncharacterized protein isoform X4 n=1 Tax=Primulina huaijiensis TaxID=1492673 RepID=UPI003CC74E1A